MPVAGFNRPGDGAGIRKSIKSIQKIAVSLAGMTQTVTINPVNVNNSIVLVDYVNAQSNIIYTPNVELTNSTTITLNAVNSPPANTIYLTVIEFNNVKSKQSGSVTANGTTAIANPYTISINSVNPVKCIAVVTSSCSSSGGSVILCSGSVTSSNVLTCYLSSSGTGISGTMKWQLIELL